MWSLNHSLQSNVGIGILILNCLAFENWCSLCLNITREDMESKSDLHVKL